MIKRAMISGLASTGVDVADLRVLPAAVGAPPAEVARATTPASTSASAPPTPRSFQIRFFEPPGIQLTPEPAEGDREALHARRVPPRRRSTGVGEIAYPARVRESYAQDLLDALDGDAIRERGFRIVVDYGYSAASFVLPLVLGPLGVEVVGAHAFSGGTETAAGAA